MKRGYLVICYWLSWVAFSGVTLALNFACWPWLWAAGRPGAGRRMRRIIRRLFDFWVRWFHACGVLRLDWGDLPPVLPAGVVYAANHPSILDATFLLSRVEDAICITKPALLRNPLVGPAARLGGYVSGESMIDVVRDAAEALRAGCALVVFPEGTRTEVGQTCGELKPGFALIALRAGVPVQLIHLEVSRGVGERGRRWWKPPAELPARYSVRLGARCEPRSDLSAREITEWARQQFQSTSL